MVYFQLAVYFLVIIWIQDSVAQNKLISISANPTTTVLPGEEYEITCESRYANFLIKRNNDWIIKVSFDECSIHAGKATDYKCVSTRNEQDYVAKLKVLGGENSPQTVQWICVFIDGRTASRILNITVRNPDRTRTTQHKPSSTLRDRTPSPTQSSRQKIPVGASSSSSSSSSSKDPQTADKLPFSRSPPDQPPFSSINIVDKLTNYFTINQILMAICVVVVLILINITIAVIVLMLLYNKPKEDHDHTKQGSSGPLALEPRGIPAEGNYDNLDRTMDDGDKAYTRVSTSIPMALKFHLKELSDVF